MAIHGRRTQIIIALLFTLLVAACGGGGDPATDGGDPPPDNSPVTLYEPDPGTQTEATPVILTLHDPARNKDLDMRVNWPVAGSNLPLIVFSHGNDGSMLAYDPLIIQWVTHGYAVIQPDHADSYLVPEPDRATDFENWHDRIDDCVFILDSLDQIEASVPAVAGKIDRDRIGMIGHSFGSQTTELLGGVVTASGDTFVDSRIRAALMISPQGLGDALGTGVELDENSWLAFSNPMMVVTGTNDAGRGGQPWTVRTEPYTYAPADGRKHLVVIDGAYHNFGDIYGFGELTPILAPDAGPIDEAQVSYVRSVSTAFLDAYLKQLPEAQAWLTSQDMEEATAGEIVYQHK